MITHNTKVSILIPCYNAERWIGQAIESALAQTWANKEVIVYDDGSTDMSPEVIQSFGGKINWECGPNVGANKARNYLLSKADGEWVQFLDADDWIAPQKIEKQLEIATITTDAIYGSANLEYWADGKLSHTKEAMPNPNHDIFAHWLNWQLAQTGVLLWRREKILEIGAWNTRVDCCHDNEITMRALMQGLSIKYCDFIGLNYRLWSAISVGRRDLRTLILEKTMLIDEMLEWLDKTKKIKPTHIKIAGRAYFDMAKKIADSDRNESIRYAKKYKARGLFDPGNSGIPFWMTYHLLGFETALLITPLWRKIKSVLS
jgi:glycosyltransferase involved in cell wall biosynthesis